MVDLHSHILPFIDDGPSSLEESIALIKMELTDGVGTIAVTPHFISEKYSGIEQFCAKRTASEKALREGLGNEALSVEIIKAAEVALRVDLPKMQGIQGLCYEGTDYMLVELPGDYYYDWIPQALYNLQLIGVTPVLAHIERYDYLINNKKNLYELVETGCITQINASYLLATGHAGLSNISKLIKQGLVHLVVTDTHSVKRRPPQLKAAMNLVQKKWGENLRNYLCGNATAIVENRRLELL